ncbi:ABC transporter permease [Vibrio methylphosphonaticus]|uniref:ABC transporter permease n=1 Tax=Vibrio methylphosphonaticus TaxID=2946866 RepID=UPI00202A9F22|nr:ABC transporter permease [Vibrio methylphosphonaticus]MCL9773605.1 ABC transporter permease [Vibrio methylphosphonaticus]
MLVKLAWRNLWRQKRRTILTASALALALCLSLLTRSFQEGSYNANIDNAARFYTGLIQLQDPDYADNASIDDLLSGNLDDFKYLKSEASIEYILPRLESVALAAAGDRSKGVMVLGVNPELEDRYSGISEKVSQGRFILDSEFEKGSGVLIGEGLAKYLRLEVGDEIILYGQGYQGQTASGLYTVNGLLKFPVMSLDNQLVYMPIREAQRLYSTGNQLTSWVLHTQTLNDVGTVEASLAAHFGDAIRVRDWKDLSPEMAQQIEMDRAGGIFLIYLLYGIVGFGLFATIMMMTLERQREFGVMLAAGMSRGKLVSLLFMESSFICILGIALGITLAMPILGYFHFNPIHITGEAAKVMLEAGFEPILPVYLSLALFINQALAITLMLLICLLGPTWKVLRLNLVGALKGGGHDH